MFFVFFGFVSAYTVLYLGRPAHLCPTLSPLFAGSICCWRRRLGGGDSLFDIQVVADHIQVFGIEDRQVRS